MGLRINGVQWRIVCRWLLHRSCGVQVNNIAKWDGTKWTAVGEGLGTYGYSVSTLIVYDGELYAGGYFIIREMFRLKISQNGMVIGQQSELVLLFTTTIIFMDRSVHLLFMMEFFMPEVILTQLAVLQQKI
jgi:hypothetical protein